MKYFVILILAAICFADVTFNWTPSPCQSGVYEVTFEACDDKGACADDTVFITVLDDPNIVPVFYFWLQCSEEYSSCADLNGDSYINFKDYALWSHEYKGNG